MTSHAGYAACEKKAENKTDLRHVQPRSKLSLKSSGSVICHGRREASTLCEYKKLESTVVTTSQRPQRALYPHIFLSPYYFSL